MSCDDTNLTAHFARIKQILPEALHDYIRSTSGQDHSYRYEPLALRPADWPGRWDQETKGRTVAVHRSPLALSTHLHVPLYLSRRGVRQITADPGERYMSPAHIPAIRRFLPRLNAFLPMIFTLVYANIRFVRTRDKELMVGWKSIGQDLLL